GWCRAPKARPETKARAVRATRTWVEPAAAAALRACTLVQTLSSSPARAGPSLARPESMEARAARRSSSWLGMIASLDVGPAEEPVEPDPPQPGGGQVDHQPPRQSQFQFYQKGGDAQNGQHHAHLADFDAD